MRYIRGITCNPEHERLQGHDDGEDSGQLRLRGGWAHYCEQMVIDEGYGAVGPAAGEQAVEIKAAKYRLAQLDESLLRVCRLCVSIQMHCQGMSVEEAAKFFQDNCYYGEKPARAEAMRGTFDPGYLNYTLAS